MLIVLAIVAFLIALPSLVFVCQLGRAAAQDTAARLRAMPSAAEADAILERAKWRGELGPLVEAKPQVAGKSSWWATLLLATWFVWGPAIPFLLFVAAHKLGLWVP